MPKTLTICPTNAPKSFFPQQLCATAKGHQQACEVNKPKAIFKKLQKLQNRGKLRATIPPPPLVPYSLVFGRAANVVEINRGIIPQDDAPALACVGIASNEIVGFPAENQGVVMEEDTWRVYVRRQRQRFSPDVTTITPLYVQLACSAAWAGRNEPAVPSAAVHSVPGGSGQQYSFCAMPHCPWAVGSGTPLVHYLTPCRLWVLALLQYITSLPWGNRQ